MEGERWSSTWKLDNGRDASAHFISSGLKGVFIDVAYVCLHTSNLLRWYSAVKLVLQELPWAQLRYLRTVQTDFVAEDDTRHR